MTTPADWIKRYGSRTDQACWDEYVMTERTWNEDFVHHSAHNVLSEVLTHRGIIAARPNDIVWEVLEAMFPNGCEIKGAVLGQVREHPERFNAARDAVARALTAAKNRGMRKVQGFFVHHENQHKKLYKEMQVLDPLMALTQKSVDRQDLLVEGFARAFMDATRLSPEEAEMVVQRGIAQQAAGERNATQWNERIYFQKRGAR